MPLKEGLKLEVAAGSREVRLGAYRTSGIEVVESYSLSGTAVVRNRMPGGVGGRGP